MPSEWLKISFGCTEANMCLTQNSSCLLPTRPVSQFRIRFSYVQMGSPPCHLCQTCIPTLPISCAISFVRARLDMAQDIMRGVRRTIGPWSGLDTRTKYLQVAKRQDLGCEGWKEMSDSTGNIRRGADIDLAVVSLRRRIEMQGDVLCAVHDFSCLPLRSAIDCMCEVEESSAVMHLCVADMVQYHLSWH